MTSSRKPRRVFTSEFKNQIVQLYNNGKRKCDIIKEYDIAASVLDKWIKQADTTGSFKEKDNRSTEEQEILKLKKELKQLQIENDILKQAVLILGQR
jgi:transposase